MIQFLHPVWLWGITAVAIPLAIHLWNINRGKVLRVGSISLLTESLQSRARTVRLNEWLLLLLRSLLIIFLSVMLAGPQWQTAGSGPKDKGWILADPGQKNIINRTFSSLIDSLEKVGYQWKEFTPGFPEWNEKSLPDSINHTPADYWELIRSLNDCLPGDFPVFLFTVNELRHFQGSRPGMTFKLHWLNYTTKDSVISYPGEAFAVSEDSVYVSVIKSGPAKTSASPEIIPLNQQKDAPYHFTNASGFLQVVNRAGIAAPVDTSTMRITIYAEPETNTDLTYLQAVLQTIRDAKRRKMLITRTDNVSGIPADQDWVFWLSGKKVPAGLRAKNIFRYAEGSILNMTSVIRIPDEGMEVNNPPRLFKRNSGRMHGDDSIHIVWSDGGGRPVLHREEGKETVYIFSCRFDPVWSDLVWHARFPEWMYQLIYPSDMQSPLMLYDKGEISAKQMMPFRHAGQNKIKRINSSAVSLSGIFWLVLFLIFLAERWVSHRSKTVKADVG